MNKIIKGAGVALVTPFCNKKEVDFETLKLLVKHVIKGKIDFLVALGTTAETVTLTNKEKSEVLKCIIETNNGEVPIVIGLGSNNTKQLVEDIKNTDFTGIDGILSVAPYYNKPNQRGIYEHFKEIASSTELPIIIYNVPGRTSSNILPETCLKLASDFKNIIGIKEASGNIFQTMDIIKNKPKSFKVFSGDDALTMPMISIGAEGVISVIANAYPQAMSDMVNIMLTDKNVDKAANIHYQMYDIINAIFADGNPAGIKALLEHLGIGKANLRLPLVTIDNQLNAKMHDLCKASKLK